MKGRANGRGGPAAQGEGRGRGGRGPSAKLLASRRSLPASVLAAQLSAAKIPGSSPPSQDGTSSQLTQDLDGSDHGNAANSGEHADADGEMTPKSIVRNSEEKDAKEADATRKRLVLVQLPSARDATGYGTPPPPHYVSQEGLRETEGGARVKVTIRVRPLLPNEKNEQDAVTVLPDGQSLVVSDGDRTSKPYMASEVIDSRSRSKDGAGSQAAFFERVGHSLVQEALEGYNVCLMAYGHTGSGKTYTMLGGGQQFIPSIQGESRGLIPRFLHELGEKLQADGLTEPKCSCEFIELYNERIRDLLTPPKPGSGSNEKRVHVHPRLGVVVEGLQPSAVSDMAQAFQLLHFGNQMRTVAATTMNQRSSRSHAIFTLKVEFGVVGSGEEPDSPGGTGARGRHRHTTIMFCDLAGREDRTVRLNNSSCYRETVSINMSLFHLANVVHRLADQSSRGRQPSLADFRNSKLTLLLSQALMGNSRTLLVATVAPVGAYYDDTIQTLNFAREASHVRTRPEVNNKSPKGMIKELEAEVERLRKELHDEKTKGKTESDELLLAAEALMKGYNCSWTEVLQKSQVLEKLRTEAAMEMGLGGQPANAGWPFLTNLSDDPALQGICNYFLSDQPMTIGSDTKQCKIVLRGLGILPVMARVTCPSRSEATIEVIGEDTEEPPRVLINGATIEPGNPHTLHGMDCLILGYSHSFRLIVPRLAGESREPSKGGESLLGDKPNLDLNITNAMQQVSEESGEQFQAALPYLRYLGAHAPEGALASFVRALHRVCPLVDEANLITKEVRENDGLHFQLHVLTDFFEFEGSEPDLVVSVLWDPEALPARARRQRSRKSITSEDEASIQGGGARGDEGWTPLVTEMGLQEHMTIGDSSELLLSIWPLEKFLGRLIQIRELYEEGSGAEDDFASVRRWLRENPSIDPWHEASRAGGNLVVDEDGADAVDDGDLSPVSRLMSPCASIVSVSGRSRIRRKSFHTLVVEATRRSSLEGQNSPTQEQTAMPSFRERNRSFRLSGNNVHPSDYEDDEHVAEVVKGGNRNNVVVSPGAAAAAIANLVSKRQAAGLQLTPREELLEPREELLEPREELLEPREELLAPITRPPDNNFFVDSGELSAEHPDSEPPDSPSYSPGTPRDLPEDPLAEQCLGTLGDVFPAAALAVDGAPVTILAAGRPVSAIDVADVVAPESLPEPTSAKCAVAIAPDADKATPHEAPQATRSAPANLLRVAPLQPSQPQQRKEDQESSPAPRPPPPEATGSPSQQQVISAVPVRRSIGAVASSGAASASAPASPPLPLASPGVATSPGTRTISRPVIYHRASSSSSSALPPPHSSGSTMPAASAGSSSTQHLPQPQPCRQPLQRSMSDGTKHLPRATFIPVRRRHTGSSTPPSAAPEVVPEAKEKVPPQSARSRLGNHSHAILPGSWHQGGSAWAGSPPGSPHCATTREAGWSARGGYQGAPGAVDKLALLKHLQQITETITLRRLETDSLMRQQGLIQEVLADRLPPAALRLLGMQNAAAVSGWPSSSTDAIAGSKGSPTVAATVRHRRIVPSKVIRLRSPMTSCSEDYLTTQETFIEDVTASDNLSGSLRGFVAAGADRPEVLVSSCLSLPELQPAIGLSAAAPGESQWECERCIWSPTGEQNPQPSDVGQVIIQTAASLRAAGATSASAPGTASAASPAGGGGPDIGRDLRPNAAEQEAGSRGCMQSQPFPESLRGRTIPKAMRSRSPSPSATFQVAPPRRNSSPLGGVHRMVSYPSWNSVPSRSIADSILSRSTQVVNSLNAPAGSGRALPSWAAGRQSASYGAPPGGPLCSSSSTTLSSVQAPTLDTSVRSSLSFVESHRRMEAAVPRTQQPQSQSNSGGVPALVRRLYESFADASIRPGSPPAES